MNKLFFSIISDESPSDWEISDFKKQYDGVDSGWTKCVKVVASEKGEEMNSDNVQTLILRSYINLIKAEQKYFIGLKFYNFGKIITLDLISLADVTAHKSMVCEHLRRMNWVMFPSLEGDELGASMISPLMCVGGWVSRGDNSFSFDRCSQDYGGSLLRSESNNIAAYVASTCGFDVSNDVTLGRQFAEGLLATVLELKGQLAFYENLLKRWWRRGQMECFLLKINTFVH